MANREAHNAVLVVEPDAEERERLGSCLEDAGFEVLLCPGPTEPDYTCLGARTGACPLAFRASIVILDMSLDSDALMTGTAAEELLALYLSGEHGVVALDAHPRHDTSDRLVRLQRRPDPQTLVNAVRSLPAAGEVDTL
jgi:CheY-like chemotaxis protein